DESELAGMLFLIEPPGNVELMAIRSVFIERRQILEQRNLTAHAAADRIHQVSANLAAEIRESIRKLRVLGVEQNTDRFARARRQYDNPCGSMPVLSALAVDEAHAVRPAVAPERDLINPGVGGDLKVSGLERGWQMHGRRLIVGADRAAAPARCRPEARRAGAHVLGKNFLRLEIARMQARRRTFEIERLRKNRTVTRYH